MSDITFVREITDPYLKTGMVVSLQMQYRNPYNIESNFFFASKNEPKGFYKL